MLVWTSSFSNFCAGASNTPILFYQTNQTKRLRDSARQPCDKPFFCRIFESNFPLPLPFFPFFLFPSSSQSIYAFYDSCKTFFISPTLFSLLLPPQFSQHQGVYGLPSHATEHHRLHRE
ncbi:hypothetical protein M408DRAFT_181004 [Serendipita vermifera MAFF 305830]|uniref:Uncharacterized protein n=1 Tax=Serendipita vermifera MAFF 305830 TaxID=933852 RepID=A0A0C2XBJ9_SERVB|nr:hypothetical protein M408DRAFT_181004 [Serendipita vermifera MAFF 305830]